MSGGLGVPGGPQPVQRGGQLLRTGRRPSGAVAGGGTLGGAARCVGAVVGAVPAERGNPLLPGVCSTSCATRWTVFASRPRVMPTYADAAVVCSPITRWAVSVVVPWAPCAVRA